MSSVAVVMANYNHARYLPESLNGVASQTRPADEIILIDDGSTDSSVEIIERFAAGRPNVRFIRNARNLGVHASISAAMEVVTADYVVWTAADDRLLPAFLERSMAALDRHPEAGLCFSETTQLSGDTGEVMRFAEQPGVRHMFDLAGLAEYLAPADLIARMKQAYLPIASNTVVVKRAALRDLGNYPRALEWFADSFIYTVIALRFGACVVADTLALIRATPGSYSSSMQQPEKQMAVLARMLDLLATAQYRDIRRIFRACPSNFSPGGALMLRAQRQRIRDWDLLAACLWWRLVDYKFRHQLTWFRVFTRAIGSRLSSRRPTSAN